ncbi:unnamed protein product [Caenorhabditis bovis]|uniref:Phorbol-ester/DAG-type domain-containing protein n=1 Tax=Caenorhabditis bovis TaxID=2654633 RepID=A0A8S1EK53_9PELO|nr:unnamed protein product [Caenorhabditis bovis]
MEVAATIGACIISAPIIYKLARPRKKTVNCWFCNKDTKVDAVNVNSFVCPHCEQYNGFTKDGDYNRRIPEQSHSMATPKRFCQSVNATKKRDLIPERLNGLRMSPKNENGLCGDCNRNQELIMKKIADFEPINEERWNEELEEFRYKLDRIYQLCPRCTLAVHGKIEEDKKKYSYLLDVRYKLKRAIGSTINGLMNPNSKRSRRFFFAGGRICESLRFLVLSCAISYFIANVDFLQKDAGVNLVNMPPTANRILQKIYEFSAEIHFLILIAHLYACYINKCRTTLPDLLIPLILLFSSFTYFISSEGFSDDLALCRCACSSFLSILAAASYLLPRKKLHKKKPNKIISSAFSVASTPISQCSSQTSRNASLLEHHSPTQFLQKSSPLSVSPSMKTNLREPFASHLRDLTNEPTKLHWRERAMSPDPEVSVFNKENETMDWDDSESMAQSIRTTRTLFKPSLLSQTSGLRGELRESTPARELAPSVASMSLSSSHQLNRPSSVYSVRTARPLNSPARSVLAPSQAATKSIFAPRTIAATSFHDHDTNTKSGSVFTSISQQDRNSQIGGVWQWRVIAILFSLVLIVFIPMLRSVINNNERSRETTGSVRVATDDPTYQSYAFQPSTSVAPQNLWFGGLRSKLSQLGLFPDWMSQLGLKTSGPDQEMAASNSSQQENEEIAEYDESTLVFRPVRLENCPQTDELDPVDCWDFGATFLADLDSNHISSDTIERQHFGPLKDLITTGNSNKTLNHNFKTYGLVHPTWCDKCGDFIWGILKEALKCENCNYTCHVRCKHLVTLDCRSPGSSLDSLEAYESIYPQLDGTLGTIPKNLNLPSMTSSTGSDKENGNTPTKCETSVENPIFSTKHSFTLPKSFSPIDSPTKRKASAPPESQNSTLKVIERYVKEDTPFEWTEDYREQDLQRKIDAYNAVFKGNEITMHDDGINYGGHILVHMNLSRPISVIQGVAPPTVYDVVNTAKSTSKSSTLRTITSFFLPRNTVKTINIDSKTTARKMIVTLLKKFHVADNPRKFALYECEQSQDDSTCTLQRKLTRISDDACPLKVVLNWEKPDGRKCLVLQENDTGDILWDAFEIPELDNFLRILGMEEKQYIWQTQQKYAQYRYAIDAELRSRGHLTSEEAVAPPEQMSQSEYVNRLNDDYGTSDSLLFSGTMKNPEEPDYVNLEYLKNQNMDQSTNL